MLPAVIGEALGVLGFRPVRPGSGARAGPASKRGSRSVKVVPVAADSTEHRPASLLRIAAGANTGASDVARFDNVATG